MATTEELQTWLTQAETAYHDLLTGKVAKVFVDQNGERVEFAATSAPRLAAYIQELKRQLGTLTTSGPMRVYF